MCVCACVCVNLACTVCKNTGFFCALPVFYSNSIFQKQRSCNILIFVEENCECITHVCSVYPFKEGNQLYVEPVRHIMAELHVQKSINVKK